MANWGVLQWDRSYLVHNVEIRSVFLLESQMGRFFFVGISKGVWIWQDGGFSTGREATW